MIKAPKGVMFCLLLVACSSILGDSEENVACDGVTDDVQFELTFTGDVSFQGPHAGDRLTDALICTGGDGFSGGSGPIFGPPGPPATISFGFGSTIQSGAEYQIYLWIDSNIGGGTVGFVTPLQSITNGS